MSTPHPLPRINLRSGKIWMTRFKITRGRSQQYYCWYYKYSIDGGKSLISTLINPSAWSGNQSWQAAVPRRRLALYQIHGFDFFCILGLDWNNDWEPFLALHGQSEIPRTSGLSGSYILENGSTCRYTMKYENFSKLWRGGGVIVCKE